ncbi:MAG: AAA family ATPase [Phycisphaera sp.]|nr:MAG: AAA family ATPase [Phycisphaera sp.]
MRVRSVDIRRSPGISEGFKVHEFSDGLTIIEGRNESGKSTLAGAIRALVWPQRSATLRARGEFYADASRFNAFVDQHGGGWEGDAPAVPDPSAGRGMIVGIGDLWHEDEHDQAVRNAMTRELQGGYDLAALHGTAQASSPTKPAREAREAERQLNNARNAARALMAKEATLPDLRAQADRGRAHAARRSQIKAAIERLDLLERLAAQRHELEPMPEGAQRVTGNEEQRLRAMRAAIDEAQAAITQEHNAAREARGSLDRLGLPEHGVPLGDQQVLTDLASELAAVERQLSEATRRASQAQAEADATTTPARVLNSDELTNLETALDAAHQAREQRARDKAAAEQWVPPAVGRQPAVLPVAILVTALLAGTAAAIASAWISVGFSVVVLVLSVLLLLRKPESLADPLAELRERAERSEASYQACVQAVREIAGNDDTLTSTLAIATAADRASRHDKLLTDLHGARAGVEALGAERDAVLRRAAASLSQYTEEPCTSADDLTRQLADLKQRAQEHARLAQDATQADQRATQNEQRRDRARRDYQTELETLSLTEDRLPELSEWLRYREPAQRLASQVRENEALLKGLDESLATTRDLRGLDRPALETKLNACDTAEAHADKLRQDIGGIESEIRNAKAGADVSQALAGLERAAQAVADARDHECAKAARRLILDHAMASMERNDMPALVRHADELLIRFTSNAYGLRIGDRSEPVVYDLRAGSTKNYDQLSTGTRAQALLAMRLASALEAERRAGSTPLPLVLDEPLATTDDQRFEAVARAMFELAVEGRQLIYLTCEPAHAHRLERLAAEHGISSARKSLDAIRGREATERNPARAMIEPKPVPTPQTVSREGYLEWRGVVPLNPWASTDAIDLYHVLPEHLDTLHDLKLRGITTVGQLLDLARRQGEKSQFPEFVLAAQVTTRLIEAWRQGRARPVETADLVESNAVSDTYLDRVVELNSSLGGSARALMDAIESGGVKGFRANKSEQLRDWLGARGLLPVVPPEPRAEVLRRALGDLIMGISNQNHSFLLTTSNRLLDLLDSPNPHPNEAPADLQA